MASISVLRLSSEDISEHLHCDKKRVQQIMGMAVKGKFTDALMDSFWQVIESFDDILDSEDESNRKVYEKMGKEMECKNQ